MLAPCLDALAIEEQGKAIKPQHTQMVIADDQARKFKVRFDIQQMLGEGAGHSVEPALLLRAEGRKQIQEEADAHRAESCLQGQCPVHPQPNEI